MEALYCTSMRLQTYRLYTGFIECHKLQVTLPGMPLTIRYDTTEEFNVDSEAEHTALSSTRSQKQESLANAKVSARQQCVY